jgi:D-alanyl-D-alanine carboxypeptidase/D-alanyl-D-alanine-endopeptidase (penicillin-binding protein 4)
MPLVRRLSLVAVATLFGTTVARAESLDSRIDALFANPQLKSASVSLDVVEVTPSGPVPLYSHDATLPLGPASNCKLLTTSAAFERYGPHAVFKTLLYRVGDDLLLLGGGDPALGDSKLAAESNEKPTTVFEQWADQLREKGVISYRHLIVDDRIFDRDWTNPNWPPKDSLEWFSAPIGGLNFNANCLDFTPKLTARGGVTLELVPDTSYVDVSIKATRGSPRTISFLRPAMANTFTLRGTLPSSDTAPSSVPIYDPGLWTGTILKDVLARAGIQSTVKDCVVRPADSDRFTNATLLAFHETPILNVIRRANTNSLNMMAEGLCKRLGYDSTGGKEPGSWANGTAAVQTYVTSLGAKSEWILLDDGSGLSNKNRVSARAFTTVLAHVGGRPDASDYIATLAIPRSDGTLERRFKGLSVADHVHAKTGHIQGVSCLSGYIEMGDSIGDGRRFAFSILCNKYQGNVNPWQDQVCQAIYSWVKGK